MTLRGFAQGQSGLLGSPASKVAGWHSTIETQQLQAGINRVIVQRHAGPLTFSQLWAAAKADTCLRGVDRRPGEIFQVFRL
ncbi:hypothetical protein PAEH1_03625 [Paenalcaligenes hominis]|uniref:Uncharacterized protein n=1 Tax=Paenalcaligenes hominis TaxID=643674 RepID=A0A1U9JYR2_9BURK|nr:hypothetical protein PAEH1_03625 [Paenalcaligenes hominis]